MDLRFFLISSVISAILKASKLGIEMTEPYFERTLCMEMAFIVFYD
jgi:hypothetical protein